MKSLSQILSSGRILITDSSADGGHGFIPCLDPKRPSKQAEVQWSNGGGWEHVSVSWPSRCPTWGEMCKVKDIFFRKDEWVMELHPPESEYVNLHEYCLHLWKPIGQDIPTPPSFMVGPRKGQTKEDAKREATEYLRQYYAAEAAAR